MKKLLPNIRFSKKRIWVAVSILAVWIILSSQYSTPILMYHHIDYRDQQWKLSVSPESFAKQMEFLKAHQYKVLSLSDYVDRLKHKKHIPKKAVVITFDDGYDNNFINAFPVLKKMGFPATVFIQADGVNRKGYMTDEDIMILLDNEIEIGSHTIHHGFLPNLDTEAKRKEIYDSKSMLEMIIRNPVTLFAYPGGGIDEESRKMVMDAGYEGAVATAPGHQFGAKDPFALKRIRISRTADNLFVFWIKISGFYSLIEEIRG